MAVLGWGLLALVVAALAAVWIQYQTFKRGVHHSYPVEIDGRRSYVQVHYQSRFARWLKRNGFAMGGHLWLYHAQDTVYREIVAHELVHFCQREVVGPWRYTAQALAQWAVQWVWRRRSTEEEARRDERALADSPERAVIVVAGRARLVSAPFLLAFRRKP